MINAELIRMLLHRIQEFQPNPTVSVTEATNYARLYQGLYVYKAELQ